MNNSTHSSTTHNTSDDPNLPPLLARIDNRFIFYARYQLSAKEAKIILFLIAQMNPLQQQNLIEQTVSVKQLAVFLQQESKHWGSFYKELRQLRDSLVRKGIYLPSSIRIDGQEFEGYINWFQEIRPLKDQHGNIALRFLFSSSLQPFLLNLKRYVTINLEQVNRLKSAFSIRIFQILRAYLDKTARHRSRPHLTYQLEELKSLLGISNKYHDFRNFKRRVLDTVVREINQHTSLQLRYLLLKQGRKVQQIRFEFYEKKDNPKENSKKHQHDQQPSNPCKNKNKPRCATYSCPPHSLSTKNKKSPKTKIKTKTKTKTSGDHSAGYTSPLSINASTDSPVQKQTQKQVPKSVEVQTSEQIQYLDNQLTFAQLKAFRLLTDYGIRIPPALHLIRQVPGSQTIGFEDWYFEEVIRIFESKTNQTTPAAKAGTLVNWFLKHKIFEQGDYFAQIQEQLQIRKKQLQKANPVAWDNRLLAKELTAEVFRGRVVE